MLYRIVALPVGNDRAGDVVAAIFVKIIPWLLAAAMSPIGETSVALGPVLRIYWLW